MGKRTSTSPTGANLYTPPMGMVEIGENPYDATVRECFEETGIKLPKHKVVSYDTETYPMQGKQYTGANFYAFLDGTISNYPIGDGDGENEKFIWIPLSKIKTIPWAFGTGNKMREIMNKLKIEMAKNTIRLTESELKKIISESVKKVLKEEFNSPLPSFAAKEVEPKHRLRKQWDDDYDAMVAKNHARGDEFMDSFNKKANLSYGKSLKENDDFKAHGYRGTSNWGGLEMQISDSGDAARLRNSVTNQVSDWLEIQFDEDGVAYVVDENGDEERLCDYMRY